MDMLSYRRILAAPQCDEIIVPTPWAIASTNLEKMVCCRAVLNSLDTFWKVLENLLQIYFCGDLYHPLVGVY